MEDTLGCRLTLRSKTGFVLSPLTEPLVSFDVPVGGNVLFQIIQGFVDL
jgi:hypothetical protein